MTSKDLEERHAGRQDYSRSSPFVLRPVHREAGPQSRSPQTVDGDQGLQGAESCCATEDKPAWSRQTLTVCLILPLQPRPPIHTHLSRSCFLVRLWALSAFSSACRLRSSARTSSSESSAGRSSDSSRPWAISSSLMRLSRDFVCGTLQGRAVLCSRPACGGPLSGAQASKHLVSMHQVPAVFARAWGCNSSTAQSFSRI